MECIDKTRVPTEPVDNLHILVKAWIGQEGEVGTLHKKQTFWLPDLLFRSFQDYM